MKPLDNGRTARMRVASPSKLCSPIVGLYGRQKSIVTPVLIPAFCCSRLVLRASGRQYHRRKSLVLQRRVLLFDEDGARASCGGSTLTVVPEYTLCVLRALSPRMLWFTCPTLTMRTYQLVASKRMQKAHRSVALSAPP